MTESIALPPSQGTEHRFAEAIATTFQTGTLEQRLADEAKRLRDEAKLLPPCAVRNEIIRKARQAETGAHISERLRSSGLQQAPK